MTELTKLSCICGSMESLPWGEKEGANLVLCHDCGLGRVDAFDPVAYLQQYSSGHYHNGDRKKRGHVPYAERIDHDRQVSEIRIVKLKRFKSDGIILDVGCGNGAFVETAMQRGYDSYGCDVYIGACDDRWIKVRLIEGEISEVPTSFRKCVDIITMHDVLEHCVDPVRTVEFARALLADDGLLVIDVPDFGCDGARERGMNFHHVKPSEHLWYFSERHLRTMLDERTWKILEVDHPIPGKLVMYVQPKPSVLDIVARVPPGIGDIHWCIMKADALRRAYEPCTLKVEVSGMSSPETRNRSIGFLDLIPFVDSCSVENFDFTAQTIPTKSNPVFMMYPNTHLEAGNRLETWHPELTTDHDYPLFAPAVDKQLAKEMKAKAGGRLFVFHFASAIYYRDFTLDSWRIEDWKEVTEWVIDRYGASPVIIGSLWDLDFAENFWRHVDEKRYVNLVGKTSAANVLAIFREAEVVCGPACGMTIMALHVGAKVVAGWPVREFRPRNVAFDEGMRTSWTNDEQMRRYVPIGWDVCTPDKIKDAIARLVDVRN